MCQSHGLHGFVSDKSAHIYQLRVQGDTVLRHWKGQPLWRELMMPDTHTADATTCVHKHTGKYLIVVLDGGNGVDVNVCLLRMLRQGDEADIRQTLTHTAEHNDPSDKHGFCCVC